MKYMLLIYFDELALSETEREECYVESTQLAQEIQASGQYLAAHPLHPDIDGDQRPGARRQTVRDRRSVRGDA